MEAGPNKASSLEFQQKLVMLTKGIERDFALFQKSLDNLSKKQLKRLLENLILFPYNNVHMHLKQGSEKNIYEYGVNLCNYRFMLVHEALKEQENQKKGETNAPKTNENPSTVSTSDNSPAAITVASDDNFSSSPISGESEVDESRVSAP